MIRQLMILAAVVAAIAGSCSLTEQIGSIRNDASSDASTQAGDKITLAHDGKGYQLLTPGKFVGWNVTIRVEHQDYSYSSAELDYSKASDLIPTTKADVILEGPADTTAATTRCVASGIAVSATPQAGDLTCSD